MDIYKIGWTALDFIVFRILCIKSGTGLSVREIARTLKASPTAVSTSLKKLEKAGFAKIVKSRNLRVYSVELNTENIRAVDLKRIENLKLVYESGLVDFLRDNFPGRSIFLFGSYSRGEDIWSDEMSEHSSDIDIAVIGGKKKEVDLSKFNKILEREVFINFYDSWKEIHKELKENILRGVVIQGNIEL